MVIIIIIIVAIVIMPPFFYKWVKYKASIICDDVALIMEACTSQINGFYTKQFLHLDAILGNLRTTMTTLSTTTGSELQCTAQARSANFVVVVSPTTPNKVESRRPAIHKLR